MLVKLRATRLPHRLQVASEAAVFALVIVAALILYQGQIRAHDGTGAIVAGRHYSCVLTASGTVECWGEFYQDEEPPAGAFVEISAGAVHACVLTESGEAQCWGADDYGQSSGVPDGRWLQISAGGGHTCGLRPTGRVECWGNDGVGQASPPLSRFTQVSASAFAPRTCGVLVSGRVECWGGDWYAPAPPPSVAFTQVSTGGGHVCGLRADGVVECWGYDEEGQATPPNGSFTQISAGLFHTCGLQASGEVVCWGRDINGQTNPPSGRFTQISAADYHNCGIRSSGSVSCWGWDRQRQSSVPRTLQRVAASLHTPGGHEIDLQKEAPSDASLVHTAARLRGPTGGVVTSAMAEPGRQSVTLTARPDDGYRFVRWEGDADGSENPFTLTPTGYVFVMAVFEPVDSIRSMHGGRAELFANRSLPEQTWQMGQPVDLTLPAATGGSGFYTYSIKYEWNGYQTWAPAGIGFDRNTRVFSGAPSFTLDRNPVLHSFTVFLRVSDRIRLGEWDELGFVVNLIPAPSVAPGSPGPALPPAPIPSPPSSDGCRTVGPVANGIAFPERNVKISANSSTVYRVRGIGTTGGDVTYRVCADNLSISDASFAKALFTAGYYYSTDKEVDLAVQAVTIGYRRARHGYDAYIDHFRDQGLAAAVTSGLKFMNLVILAHSLPGYGIDALYKEAIEHLPDVAFELSREVLDAVAAHPEEIVKGLAWAHVQSAWQKGQPWLNSTERARDGTDTLLFSSAQLHFAWEDDIARGAAGGALAWSVAESNVRLWEGAVGNAIGLIPFGVGSVAKVLIGLEEASRVLDQQVFTELNSWLREYDPYDDLSRSLAATTKSITDRHERLFSRLGLASAAPAP